MQTAKPQITVIIPTYKRPQLLKRAVRSVLNQTYPNFQICIYDNASEDETESIIRELAQEDERVIYHCHAKNIGAFANFNYGLRHVDTPFFSFLSDDDFLLPEFFDTMMQNFIKYPDVAFSAGLSVHFNGKRIYWPELLRWKREGYYLPHEGLYWHLKHMIKWTGVIFSRKVLDSIGLLDKDMGPFSDLDFITRIVAHYPIVISKKPSVVFWEGPGTTSSSLEYHEELYHGWLKLRKKITDDETIPIEDRKRSVVLLKQIFAVYFFNVAVTSINNNNLDRAYKVVNVLKELDPVLPTILATSLSSFKYFPPLRHLFMYCWLTTLHVVGILENALFPKETSLLQKRIQEYVYSLET
jgi:glycosyltransferase involved in cell wall biosynthesis